jgi:hypothetical protein
VKEDTILRGWITIIILRVLQVVLVPIGRISQVLRADQEQAPTEDFGWITIIILRVLQVVLVPIGRISRAHKAVPAPALTGERIHPALEAVPAQAAVL